jgi:hypothetical protein
MDDQSPPLSTSQNWGKEKKNLLHPQIPLQRTIEVLVSSQVPMRQVLDLPRKGGEDSCVSGIATSLRKVIDSVSFIEFVK